MYLRNLQTLRRCQLARDNQEAPEYWSGYEDWETDQEGKSSGCEGLREILFHNQCVEPDPLNVMLIKIQGGSNRMPIGGVNSISRGHIPRGLPRCLKSTTPSDTPLLAAGWFISTLD